MIGASFLIGMLFHKILTDTSTELATLICLQQPGRVFSQQTELVVCWSRCSAVFHRYLNQFSKLTLKGPAEYLVVGYVLARAAKFSALLLTRDDVIRLKNELIKMLKNASIRKNVWYSWVIFTYLLFFKSSGQIWAWRKLANL